MVTVKGKVGNSGKYLVTAIPIDTHSHCVLKMLFENNTSGTNLGACMPERLSNLNREAEDGGYQTLAVLASCS